MMRAAIHGDRFLDLKRLLPRFLVAVFLINSCAGSDSETDTAGCASSSVETTPPRVISTIPANGEAGVSIFQPISAVFSEVADPLTVNNISFVVVVKGAGDRLVRGVVTCEGTKATFRPSEALDSNSTYVATINSRVRDTSGNALEADATWFFTTGVPDLIPPDIVSVYPAAGATRVEPSVVVSATFDEEMDPATLGTFSFFLTGPGGERIGGSVGCSRFTATFLPAAYLDYSTTYAATVSGAVEDMSGNPLGSGHTWSFTVRVVPESTPPSVVSTFPAHGTTGVSPDVAITATFSEVVDPLTVHAGSFTLKDPLGNILSGTVTCSDATASFKSFYPLLCSTVYTATLTASVRDLSGNPLSGDQTWSFTTAPDTFPPLVMWTYPAVAATYDVNIVGPFVVFNEPLDPASIDASTFTLAGPGGVPVPGFYWVSFDNREIHFQLSSPLAYSTTYTATILPGVKDLAGNPTISEYTWSFTTIPPPP